MLKPLPDLKNSTAEISVEALEKTEVMFFNVEKILGNSFTNEECQRKIVRNMLVEFGEKEFEFYKKNRTY